ncbi:MAG TPA: hypothetical protein ENG78_01675 [Acidiferrobacteraceae bacterium]|nr:hypothetical protein [Acidiferrobacteraceae bacterium]HEX19523.1 hypothetical protein [Acidiferrobacteraceae bacterium]
MINSKINSVQPCTKNISLYFVLAVFTLLSVFVVSAHADDLARISSLTRGGAPGLALRLLNKAQPPVTNRKKWTAFEKRRFLILKSQAEWQNIIDRVQSLPEGLPDDFLRWAYAQAAHASMQSNQAAQARIFLRKLIWDHKNSGNNRAWARRLVIRSYLMQNKTEDALVALQRYLQDYKPRGVSWRLLHAAVLLQVKKNKDAFAVLSGIQIYRGRILRLLAGMRANIYQANVVMIRAGNIAQRVSSKPELQGLAWHLLAEAARRNNNPVSYIQALESALALELKPNLYTRLIPLNADTLWQAYLEYAERIGNDLGLLVGDDDGWLEKTKSFDKPEKSRAFYAFLAFRAQNKTAKEAAHQLLSDDLFNKGHVNTLIALYTKSKKFTGLNEVPATVRFRLANVALQRYDIKLAATLMKGLSAPPEGKDRNLWLLHQARILIYAGDYPAAVKLLANILDQGKGLTDKFLSRYVQVMFDLQIAGKNKEAFDLLQRTYSVTRNRSSKREVLFWMADSQYALRDYVQAAELYLRSATLTAPGGGDIWGQTARFKAAEALGKAGLVRDARSVYLKLLKYTHDAKRRAIIERNIQQLWLYEKNSTRK